MLKTSRLCSLSLSVHAPCADFVFMCVSIRGSGTAQLCEDFDGDGVCEHMDNCPGLFTTLQSPVAFSGGTEAVVLLQPPAALLGQQLAGAVAISLSIDHDDLSTVSAVLHQGRTAVELFSLGSLGGSAMVDAVFASGGASIGSSSSPYSGKFAAAGSLSDFAGSNAVGVSTSSMYTLAQLTRTAHCSNGSCGSRPRAAAGPWRLLLSLCSPAVLLPASSTLHSRTQTLVQSVVEPPPRRPHHHPCT